MIEQTKREIDESALGIGTNDCKKMIKLLADLIMSDEFAEKVASKIMRYEFTPEDIKVAKKTPLTYSSNGAGGNNIEYET